MRHAIRFALAALIILCGTSVGYTIPQLINYQGVLTDGGGAPITVATSVEFRIWDMSAGGTQLWTETQSITPDADGRFNVLLGSVMPLTDAAINADSAFLGLTISPDAEVTPRTALVAVAYAFRPGTVDGASGGTITSKVTIGPGNTNSGDDAFAAGKDNTITGDYAFVAGAGNNASGDYSVISGGAFGIASGSHATIPGGNSNVAAGDYSLAAGNQAQANHKGCFVWGDETPAAFASTSNDQFLIRAGGGVGIGTNNPAATLDVSSSVNALRLRAGNTVAGTSHNQILLSYSLETSYTHAIKSRHSSYSDEQNAIDFYVWDFGTDVITDVGTKHIMTLDGASTGRVGIGTIAPTEKLEVNGNICYTGSIGACSDARYKTAVATIDNGLDKVRQMRGVTYRWKQDACPDHDFDDRQHLGFIAQEVEALFPEMVMTNDDGYKSVDYGRLTPVLVEAIKEQQKQIDGLRQLVEQIVASR